MTENKLHEQHGSKWTIDEDKKLLVEIKNKKSIDEIANEHKRSKGSIEARLRHIARELVKEGRTKDVILKVTGLSQQEYYKAIHNKNSNLYKKNIIINKDDNKTNDSYDNSNDMKQVIELLIEIRDLLKNKDI